jgi:hypothetical protein
MLPKFDPARINCRYQVCHRKWPKWGKMNKLCSCSFENIPKHGFLLGMFSPKRKFQKIDFKQALIKPIVLLLGTPVPKKSTTKLELRHHKQVLIPPALPVPIITPFRRFTACVFLARICWRVKTASVVTLFEFRWPTSDNRTPRRNTHPIAWC